MRDRPTRFFAFSLARALKVWDVDQMMKAMSSRLMSEWMVYSEIEAEQMRSAGQKSPQLSIEEQYCKACKKAKKNHCETCSRKFEVARA